MKIALVIKDFSGRRGGGEGYAYRLALELARLGHEIHIYANSWDAPEEESLVYHRVPMVRCSSILKLISFPCNAGRLLKKESFDIINGLTQILEQDVFRLGGGVAKYWLSVRARFSLLSFLVWIRPLNLINLFIERRIFTGERCRRFIVNSILCRDHLIRYYGVARERIDLVYNGVDTRRFNPASVRRHRSQMREALGVKNDETLFLFASSNPKRKGFGCLIDALAAIGDKGRSMKLLAVGSERVSAFRRMARSRGLEDRVLFEGWAGGMERYYGAADVFVLPTMYDPFANVCLEALASGLPVITTRENGAAEVVEGVGGGLIIWGADDVKGLAGAILAMAEPEARRALSERAASGAGNYTWDKTALAVLEVYRKVIDERGAGS